MLSYLAKPTIVKGRATKTTTTSTCYCYFCSCHILIMFVGMTLLIVSYGVNTVQMSAVPPSNGVSTINGNNKINSNGNIMNGGSENRTDDINRNVNSLQIALPTVHRDDDDDDGNDDNADSNNKKRTEADLVAKFENLRKPRLFGLLGSNFSLSYNLTLGGSNSAGNVTVVAAPAPAYYYAPAPAYYPAGYGYYDPYGYYNPYAYNPYAYNPYAGYSYYG